VPQRKELMEMSRTLQMDVCLYVTPWRLVDQTGGGGARYTLLEPPGGRMGLEAGLC
jgi:hypothetical protein